MKTAIVVHGYHLYADQWEKLVWGKPEYGVFGCASKALTVAHEQKTDFMIWGTGASERNGMKEAEYTFRFAQYKATGLMLRALKNCKHHIDTTSQNTKEEIAVAFAFALQEDIKRIVLVSNPTHIARCLQMALIHCWEHPEYNLLQSNLTVAVSDVCWVDSNPGDVVIFEPPHRGDQPKRQTHALAKAVMEISKNTSFDFFITEWKELIAKFGGNV